MDNLSKPELRMLLSIMEGELEARDLVIEALRVSLLLGSLWFCFLGFFKDFSICLCSPF